MRQPEEYVKEARFFFTEMQKLMSEEQAFDSQVGSAIRAAMRTAWEDGAIAGGMTPKNAEELAAKIMGYE